MEKVLMLASVASMIDQFNMPNIQILQDLGYEVHVACNFKKGNTCSEDKILELKKKLKLLTVSYFQIDFSRNVRDVYENIKAYKQVLSLMEENKYDFIHCHSPIGGVCGRLAAQKTETKVIYTAHGFHFYKGAPLKNWLIYYPVERWLARYTDILVTINKEDYNRAKKFKKVRVEYVPGVGIDTDSFENVKTDKEKKRKSLGIGNDEFMILSVGELNKNKNHQIVIKAIARLNNRKVEYVLCGQGPLKNELIKLSQDLKVEKQVRFLGFRDDVSEIYKVADLFVFPSYREGLSLSLMEAMSSGLPVVCSNIRGNNDLIKDKNGGFLFNLHDELGLEKAMYKLICDDELRKRFGDYNKKIKNFDISNVALLMKRIYLKLVE